MQSQINQKVDLPRKFLPLPLVTQLVQEWGGMFLESFCHGFSFSGSFLTSEEEEKGTTMWVIIILIMLATLFFSCAGDGTQGLGDAK